MYLSQDQLLEIGLSADRDTLRCRLAKAVEALGFGLFAGALVRGDMRSGSAWIETVSNTPAGFVEAQRSLDDALRDPVTAALTSSVRPLAYDQSTYVDAGCADLWDAQAPWGYRCGIASAVHQASHAEHFVFGVDRSDPLPSSPGERAVITAQVQALLLHTQAAMQRLYTPAPAAGPDDLERVELEALRWTAAGRTVWQCGNLLSLSEAEVRRVQHSATRKVGASSVPGAVLRCIDGGLIG